MYRNYLQQSRVQGPDTNSLCSQKFVCNLQSTSVSIGSPYLQLYMHEFNQPPVQLSTTVLTVEKNLYVTELMQFQPVSFKGLTGVPERTSKMDLFLQTQKKDKTPKPFSSKSRRIKEILETHQDQKSGIVIIKLDCFLQYLEDHDRKTS